MKTILGMTAALAIAACLNTAHAGFTGGVHVAGADVTNAADACDAKQDGAKTAPSKPAPRSSSGGGGAGKVKFDRLTIKRVAPDAGKDCANAKPSAPKPGRGTHIGGGGGGAGKAN